MSQVFTLVVPQWQGCGVGAGPYYGALAMLKMWGKERVDVVIDVHEHSVAKKVEGIWYQHEILKHAEQISKILESEKPARLVTLGGDCGSDLVPISYLNHLYGGNFTLIWYGAHGDLHTPETSLTHRFHGMSVRLLLGEGSQSYLNYLKGPLTVDQIVYAGQRDLEHTERQFIVDNKMTIIAACDECNELLNLVVAKGQRNNIYLHIDLNVLNPVDFEAVSNPVPGGFRFTDLIKAIELVSSEFNIVGCSIIGYHPRGDEDDAKIRKLVELLKTIMAFKD